MNVKHRKNYLKRNWDLSSKRNLKNLIIDYWKITQSKFWLIRKIISKLSRFIKTIELPLMPLDIEIGTEFDV